MLDPAQALVQPRRWNRYAYSLNNSLAFVDPDGRDPATVATRLVQSPPVQRLINHPITQRLLASSGISSGTAALQRLNNRLFDISVKLFSTPGGHASVETAAQLLTGADLGPTGVAGGIGAVIGHYDAGYNIVGRQLGVAVFDIPPDIFARLSGPQQDRANKAFLDAIVERGYNVLVVTEAGFMRTTSILKWEIQYLLGKGYSWNDAGTALIAPNPK